MKKRKEILRILAALIDIFVIMIPIQFIMLGIFQVSARQAEFFFCILSAVYAVLAIEYCKFTLGKYFGRLQVVDISGIAPPMLYLGIRELTKALYFVPVIGWIAGIVSIFMMLIRKDGRALHDFTGNTKVVFAWECGREKVG